MTGIDKRLRDATASIERGDPGLAEELKDVRKKPAGEAAAYVERGLESLGAPQLAGGFALETIVLRTGRPVLAISGDELVMSGLELGSEVWRSRLSAACATVRTAIKASGRVEVDGHAFAQWLGTAWLIDDDVIVTNRHVAMEFARRGGDRFVFKRGFGRTMAASIDFLREVGSDRTRGFALSEVLHIQERGPDVAFLRVHTASGPLAQPLRLAARPVPSGHFVAAIGYPAKDPRVLEQELMTRIFGDAYDRKRLAPGQTTSVTATEVQHDCSTLGGNSGSALVSLETGEAVALHFAGRFLEANYAVPAATVQMLYDEVRRTSPHRPRPNHPGGGARALTFVVPVTISVAFGEPVPAPIDAPQPPAPTAPDPAARPKRQPIVATGDGQGEVVTEANAASYARRSGYQEGFLELAPVAMPTVLSGGDVLSFVFDGVKTSRLDYEHFSVVMSKSRKVCRVSAVNIDAKQYRRSTRVAWRTDPRIGKDQQIADAGYGNEPRFSRGHMTRREDPVWGDEASAARANADSMHVTNVVHQMQPFNGGIWLGLEDYALQHARKDKMRISVFTGPVLLPGDPTLSGVQVPVTFWKVIVFVHDQTQALCATGYQMSQESFLRPEEFVFGGHETAQVPISKIEHDAGLTFGSLNQIDPLGGGEESVGGRALRSFAEVRFT